MRDNTEITYNFQKGNIYPLGVSKTKEGINFAIPVDEICECSILFYRKNDTEPNYIYKIPVEYLVGGTYCVLLSNRKLNEFDYNFSFDGKICQDLFARWIIGREQWGDIKERDLRCRFSSKDFDWENDKQLELPFNKIVGYELHPRGFTKDSFSKVKKKGTISGIMEKIPYFAEVGINQIMVMPLYEFEEIIKPQIPPYLQMKQKINIEHKINYWGYGIGNYFAPKSSFASTVSPITELKMLVKELHKNNIEIIMEIFFDITKSPNYILECLKYWYIEFHIDGFRIFGERVNQEILINDSILSRAKLIFSSLDSNKDNLFEKRLGEAREDFLYTVRKFLKSDENQLDRFSYLISNNSDTVQPINTITSHNGITLMDLVSYDSKHNEDNHEDNRDGNDYNFSWNCGVEGETKRKSVIHLRNKQRKNIMIMLFLAQGTPYILAGDEFGNSQNGNNNAYCQDNRVGWIQWNGIKKDKKFFEFVKKLIIFRKNHPVFAQNKKFKNIDYKSCGYPDISFHGTKAWYADMSYSKRQLGILYAGCYTKKDDGKWDDFFYVAYNLHWTEKEFDLPKLPKDKKWYISIDSSKEQGIYDSEEEIMLDEQKNIKVSSRTIIVLRGR